MSNVSHDIKTEQAQKEQQGQVEETPTETKDTMSSAAETSNANITLKYITELQTKVSAAMSSGELTLVSSSSIYKNPYWLHITVSSNAEEDLAKLKTFDTIGGALEIVYDANPISIEDIATE